MAYKILPVMLLICSFVYAQQAPKQNKKPPPKPARKNTKKPPARPLPDSSTIVPLPPVLLEDDTAAYFDPMDTVTMRASPNAIESTVKYTARDTIVYNNEERTVYLYGDAQVNYEDLELKADFIKIQLDKNLMTATGTKDTAGNPVGKPLFKQGESEYKADLIKYNYKTKKGYLSSFRTTEGEGHIHGTNVKRNADNTFTIQPAAYTTCELDHPHYYIGSNRIKVIPDKKVITGAANLVIEDIRTPLVLPFGIFSLKRGQSSGIIIPQYGSSFGRGYFLRDGGYYFGLGPKADLRMTGDYYTNNSWGAHSGLNYASRYKFNGNLTFNYADIKDGNEEDLNFRRSKDFQLSWIHRSDPKARPNTTFSANVNVATATYLSNNSYNPTNIATNQLVSSIAFGKSFKNGRYNLGTNARMSQNTQTRDLTLSFPDLTFTVSSFAPFKSKYKPVADQWYENITTNYTVSARNDIQTKDSIFFNGWRNTNEFRNFYDTAGRFGIKHTLPVQTSFKLFKFYTLSMNVNMDEVWYWQTTQKTYDIATRTLTSQQVYGFERAWTYTPGVALNTRYYGIAQFEKGKIAAFRHVVTPTLSFSYNPDYSEPQWGYYRSYRNEAGNEIRYSKFEQGIFGGPGQGRQGNIGFALDNNLEMKVRTGKDTAQKETKIQLFESIRAASSYNIFADSLNLAPIDLSARTKLFENIQLTGNARLDPYVNEIFTSTTGTKSVVRMNRFYLDDDGSLGVITDASIGVTSSFSGETFKGKKTSTSGKPYEGELRYINDNPQDYYDFNVPWSLSITYSINYNRYKTLNASLFNTSNSNYTQAITFYGDVNVTKNWKVGYNSGYDFEAGQISPVTSVDFIRQLHCWEFKLNWIPFGQRQSFLFTINVKASVLQELRLTRRRDWFDRRI